MGWLLAVYGVRSCSPFFLCFQCWLYVRLINLSISSLLHIIFHCKHIYFFICIYSYSVFKFNFIIFHFDSYVSALKQKGLWARWKFCVKNPSTLTHYLFKTVLWKLTFTLTNVHMHTTGAFDVRELVCKWQKDYAKKIT